MDTTDKVVGISVSVSGLLFSLFYRLYKNRNRTADEIKSTEVFTVDEDLFRRLQEVDGNSIAYATVEGVVYPTYQIQKLQSKYVQEEGVIRHWRIVEHKSRRMQGYWTDAERVISNTLENVPFILTTSDQSEKKVHVTEALNAEFILDDLTVTYDQFTPKNPNMLQIGIERIFGEYSKGIQEKEKMLLVGTSLVGIGEVCLENSQVKLGPPSQGSYILSKLTRNEIIRKFESQSFVYKVITIIFGAISTGLTFYLIWKFTKKYMEHKRNRRIFDEIRATTRTAFESDAAEADSSMCIICLSHPRDVIVLDCGHVCMCSNCAQILPEPKRCPMCRIDVKRFVPLYRS
ncbi:mitochondrial ubiquitin ligase activator of nfkb 1-like [Gigantopelta aegis]|uniref:mitochondrial ubiquitin ligase activator of nfkb 1-like n=1 Tax=Gigantopelta aegis TaxID=1735272 RepID=UPI001B88D5C6|nr:mitochondrial ubiquitin ligase activator of nfkb 1-like [Gigantopelta aegis]